MAEDNQTRIQSDTEDRPVKPQTTRIQDEAKPVAPIEENIPNELKKPVFTDEEREKYNIPEYLTNQNIRVRRVYGNRNNP